MDRFFACASGFKIEGAIPHPPPKDYHKENILGVLTGFDRIVFPDRKPHQDQVLDCLKSLCESHHDSSSLGRIRNAYFI
jgi:hypothetical protein